jgi:hypothetical protein
MINHPRNMHVLDKIDLKIVHYFPHQFYPWLFMFLGV